MNKFYNKRILFISPRFFNYEVEITKSLEDMGAIVDFFDERINNKATTKALLRVFNRGLSFRIKKYYTSILQKIESKEYDYLFVIKGESIPAFFIESFKANNINAKLLYYTYDSIKNNSNTTNNFKHFDSLYSFDKKDSAAYPSLKFLPLFFLNKYADMYDPEHLFKFDVSFIGTVHSDRYIVVHKIFQELIKTNPHTQTFSFFYCQNIWYYRFRKLFDKRFANVTKKELSFTPLKSDQVAQIFKESNCVIDIQHPDQSGLTMRTFEALAAGKKIITTNEDIQSYDFYDPRIIAIIDRNSPEISKEFLSNLSSQVNSEFFKNYSIQAWLNNIFIPNS